MTKQKLIYLIIISMILCLDILAVSQNRLTVKVVPSLQKNMSRYKHNFPFEKKEAEKKEDAMVRVFYNLLVNALENQTHLKDAEVKDPDAFPYYKKAQYKNLYKDEEGIVEIPSMEFNFTFNGNSPDYVFHIDSLSIYSSSAVNDSKSGVVGGAGVIPTIVTGAVAAAQNAKSKRSEGGIGVEFKYFLWDNNKKEVITFNCCRVRQGSDNTTKEDWEALLASAIKDIFYSTNFYNGSN